MSPVCGQYRRRFRFTAAVPLPPGMPEGAVAPSPFFRRRGRVPRRGAIFCLSGRNDLPSSSISSVPKTSAEGKSLPIYRHRSSSSGDAGRGRRPFRSLPPARKQFVSHQQSMPSALPIYRRRSSSSGDAGRGRRPFRFLPQAGACTPLGDSLSPVCGQCRQRFRFIAAVSLPPGMPEGAAAPSALFRRRGVYPARKQFVPRQRSMPSALPIYRRRSSPSGDAGRGRRPFRFLPQAGACTPPRRQFVPRLRSMPSALPIHRHRSSSSGDAGRGAPSAFFRKRGRVPRRGNNLSPVCGQCRQRFRFTAAVPLPPGCRKGPPPLPLSSAGGGVYPAEERFSVCQDATTCRPLLFHPFRKPLPKENRFRYIKVRVRQCRARTFMLLAKEDVSSLANFLTGENLPPTRSAAASPSTGSWSPRRFPTHNAHRDRSAPRTSCTSRPTAQPSLRQW